MAQQYPAWIWHNGQIKPWAEGTTHVMAHALHYGSSVFEGIRAYETALNLYRMDNFRYPTTEQGLQALVQKPSDPNIRNWKEGGYIDGLKKDPWGRDYLYISPGTRGEFDLYTLGADGQPDGEGPDADIGNWNIE